MALVLFDVDDTLTKQGIVEHFDYHHAAVKKYFNLDVYDGEVYRHGKTQRAIFIEFLEKKGMHDPEKDPRFEKMIADIETFAAFGLGDKKVPPIPNVELVLQALQKKGHTLGLLTGNSRGMAKLKLESAGLWHYFVAGAYGDASRHRHELVEIALKEAKVKTGITFSKENVYVVGDTIADIQCAKLGGVKSIAISTGVDSMEKLQKENPDFLFKDFSDVEAIVRVIK